MAPSLVNQGFLSITMTLFKPRLGILIYFTKLIGGLPPPPLNVARIMNIIYSKILEDVFLPSKGTNLPATSHLLLKEPPDR